MRSRNLAKLSRSFHSTQESRNIGLFVSFEGQDGCGKSTIITKVSEILAQNGYPVLVVEEFSRSRFGENLLLTLTQDKFLRSNASHRSFLTQVFAILTDWMYLAEYVIIPNLNAGKLILKDRYIDSVIACQMPTVLDEYHFDEKVLYEWFLNVVRIVPAMPDLTFFLDVPLEVRMQRLYTRERTIDEHRAHEISEDDIRVFTERERFYALLAAQNRQRFLIFNNDRDLEIAADQIFRIIVSAWNKKNSQQS